MTALHRINPDDVRRLSETDNLTTKEIAAVLGFHQNAISHLAARHGIILTRRDQTSAFWERNHDRAVSLWNEGYSTSRIAVTIGTTKNAVVGRLSRAGLIGARTQEKPKREQIEFPPPGRCVFPHSDPGAPDFAFCGLHAEPGGPYCQHHHRVAYRPAGSLNVAA